MRHIIDAVQVPGALLVEQILRFAAHDFQRIRAKEQLTRFTVNVCGGGAFKMGTESSRATSHKSTNGTTQQTKNLPDVAIPQLDRVAFGHLLGHIDDGAAAAAAAAALVDIVGLWHIRADRFWGLRV